MDSKSCFSMFTVVTLGVAVLLGFVFSTLSGAPSPLSLAFSDQTTTDTPTPPEPAACLPIEYTARVGVPSRVKVGDVFNLHSSSTGYAGLVETRLHIDYRLAIVPDLEVIDPQPMIEVLPESTGSSLGSADFVLRALQPGAVNLYTEVYGDAFFYSVGCNRGTTFKLVYSEPVRVVIEP
jgi:hypothetical protein